jgi:hypothetical protein
MAPALPDAPGADACVIHPAMPTPAPISASVVSAVAILRRLVRMDHPPGPLDAVHVLPPVSMLIRPGWPDRLGLIEKQKADLRQLRKPG